MSRRTERIAETLRVEIARILQEEAADPRLRMITLTRVDVAPDLSSALVFWSSLHSAEEDVAAAEDGLESAASFVRRRLARELPLRRAPELRFRHDPSLSLGTETLALLRTLSEEEGD